MSHSSKKNPTVKIFYFRNQNVLSSPNPDWFTSTDKAQLISVQSYILSNYIMFNIDEKYIRYDKPLSKTERAVTYQYDKTYIIKCFPLETDLKAELFKEEFAKWSSIDNPNILKVKAQFVVNLKGGQPHYCYVMDKMDYSFEDIIKENQEAKKIPTREELLLAWKHFLSAFCFLQKINLPYKNIKPSNVFIDEKGKVRFSDIGNPYLEEDIKSGNINIAPELRGIGELVTSSQLLKADIWRVGMLFIELGTSNFIENIKDIPESIEEMKKNYGEEVAGFISEFVTKETLLRPDGKEALSRLKEIMRKLFIK